MLKKGGPYIKPTISREATVVLRTRLPKHLDLINYLAKSMKTKSKNY